MKQSKKAPPRALFAAAFLIITAAVLPAAPDQGVYAVRNCAAVPVSGPAIEKAVIVVRDGLIQAVGPADRTPIPEDAEVIEAEGLTAYPGLILAHGNMFLELPAREAAAEGRSETAAVQRQAEEPKFPPGPGLDVLNLLKPKKETTDAWRKAGVTTVLVAPAAGIFQGLSSVLNLNGDELEPMVIAHGFALHVNFTTERGRYPSSLMGTIAYIRQSFLDALRYDDWKTRYRKNPTGMRRPRYDAFLEALVPFASGRGPVVFQCNNVEDIGRALKIIQEFRLNGILAGATEAWRAADLLKKTSRPLFVSLDFRAPSSSVFGSRGEEARRKAETELFPANAAELAGLKLPFALTAFGLADPAAFQRNLRAAVKAGLDEAEALRALTITPARLLGFERSLGSLEAGKTANIILTKGRIFDDKTTVTAVFVDGVLFRYSEVTR